jgi:adenylylsulfate reductase subunit B
MHIDKTHRRAVNIEPNMCWECYSCVKACPQNAIDVRGYADFAPLGHSVRVLREEEKGTISWKIKFRDGREKDFISPITTQPWGENICKLAELAVPSEEALNSELLCYEPEVLEIGGELPTIEKDKFKQGVYY